MNLDELRSAQAKERRKDSLQHLRDSFYDDVGAYVADLRAARDRRAEQVENPFEDDDIRRLSDEVETAEEVAEALYERRVGKVVKLASFAAADMSVDEEGMTTEERRLFDDLVERITANKSQVLDVLAGESPVPDGPAGTNRTAESEEAPSTADAEATGPDRTESPPADAGALAGAMGGDGEESASDEPLDPDESDPVPPAGSADDGDETAPVPPDPAPQGAVGVDDENGETDDLPDADLAGDADRETSPGATTDGGAVPEAGGRDGAEATTDERATPEATTSGEPAAGSEPAESTDRATVRITRDVGAIFGVDEREYELASEDVVSLPVENADPLVQRDAAERID